MGSRSCASDLRVAEIMPKPGRLVIVTGPSHAGKSTLIRELLRRAGGMGAVVSIDEEIEKFQLPDAERWERALPAAYEAAAERSRRLLRQGSLVFFESTFTYVPQERPPEFHLKQLQRLLEVAAEVDAEVAVLQLQTSREGVLARQRQTGRLTPRIVEETWRRHASEAIETSLLLCLDTSRLSAAEAADRATAHFAFLASG
jgi:predicted kinase